MAIKMTCPDHLAYWSYDHVHRLSYNEDTFENWTILPVCFPNIFIIFKSSFLLVTIFRLLFQRLIIWRHWKYISLQIVIHFNYKTYSIVHLDFTRWLSASGLLLNFHNSNSQVHLFDGLTIFLLFMVAISTARHVLP